MMYALHLITYLSVILYTVLIFLKRVLVRYKHYRIELLFLKILGKFQQEESEDQKGKFLERVKYNILCVRFHIPTAYNKLAANKRQVITAFNKFYLLLKLYLKYIIMRLCFIFANAPFPQLLLFSKLQDIFYTKRHHTVTHLSNQFTSNCTSGFTLQEFKNYINMLDKNTYISKIAQYKFNGLCHHNGLRSHSYIKSSQKFITVSFSNNYIFPRGYDNNFIIVI